MDAIKLPQPRVMQTSAVARCNRCSATVYTETVVEEHGKPIERIVTGTFRQALDADGQPTGPVIPFCNCED